MTGTLIEGNVYIGDRLVVDYGSEIPIIDVEFDNITLHGIVKVIITVPDDTGIKLYQL